jgi:hypothetical protein
MLWYRGSERIESSRGVREDGAFQGNFSADLLNAFNHPWLGSDLTRLALALDLEIPPRQDGFGKSRWVYCSEASEGKRADPAGFCESGVVTRSRPPRFDW